MCEPLLPLLIVPVSKLPSFAVAVCGATSWFVQVIVSPTCTDEVPGLNAKFLIVTPLEAAAVTVVLPWAFVLPLAPACRRCFCGTSAGAVLVRAGVAAVPAA